MKDNVVHKRKVAKRYHDRSAHDLPPLVIGQEIRAKTKPNVKRSNWATGIVRAKVAPRSYHVEVNGRCYRRNRVHIRDTIANGPINSRVVEADDPLELVEPPESTSIAEPPRSVPSSVPSVTPQTTQGATPPSPRAYVTRSGRMSKPPVKLQDYVK